MAVRIDLPAKMLRSVFETKLASLDRAIKGASNDLVAEAYSNERQQVQKALNEMTEVK